MKLAVLMFVTLHAQCGLCLSHSAQKETGPSKSEDATPNVTCTSRQIRALFGPKVLDNLQVKDTSGVSKPVPKFREQCGVKSVREKDGSLIFTSQYDSCYTRIEGSLAAVILEVQLVTGGSRFKVNISCPLQKKQFPKPRAQTQTQTQKSASSWKCNIQRALRVACGPQGVSSSACLKLGCCYNSHDSVCYYRVNVCSLDGHFVFSVKATDSSPPLDPSRLMIRGHPRCTPAVSSSEAAVFKFGVTECGATVQRIQCQYAASALLYTGQKVMNPTNPPPVTAMGSVQVQMRLAKDESYSSFYSTEELPLTLPLRRLAYVEVSIVPPSPDPRLSLRVRDCFAYPASRHSVWTLLYDGCPNPLDDLRSSVSVGKGRGVRWFDVKTFAFLDPETGQPKMEELYFYCWVEICTEEEECQQQCSTPLSDGERVRRDLAAGDQVSRLVSVGPVLLGRNSATSPENPKLHTHTVYQVLSVSSLTLICVFVISLLPFSVWWRTRRSKRRNEGEEGPTSGTEMKNVADDTD
ncbi:zona pellucida sperm-binding protein 4-like [Chanos chanos]|uniref:Zona pellucida sperm-binding protein 4-like n=1 Tax=Chanos chanos TaxID=29144 RepID=A0A6J2WXW7_CHACN|nr:zona pellucida sperm-binding protein 4-like [Chanos chanos]